MLIKPKIAISSEFFSSVLKLPKAQQDKAIKLMEQFRQDPKATGLNYETILAVRDKNLRSVRIDQAYRAIVLAPEKGDVYILLWADKHDDAYEWARKKVLKINPENGVLQFLETEYIDEATQLKQNYDVEKSKGVFVDIRDKYLIRLGVPEDLIPLVRNINYLDEIDDLKKKIPDEAYEALALLSDGSSLDEVLSAYEINQKPIDTTDFASALETPDSKRRFLLASNDDALKAMLDAPLEKWRVFLHPLQRALIYRDWNGPVRVLGGAGTGKTVVAMHRAKWLAEQLTESRENRILFTTYTKNLAADIAQNLKSICAPEVMRKIEVINLDAWVKRFLDKQGYKVSFSFYEQQKVKLCWDKALALKPDDPDLPDSFYQEEWKKVIQPQNVSSNVEYFSARRVGRGVKLNRAQRKAIWIVFEKYRLELNDAGLKEIEDAYRDAVTLIVSKGIQSPYTSVIVDEAQDLGLNAFKLIRHLVPEQKNDLFIVGDAHQRIYGNKVVLGHCGIKITGRSQKLRINYRTTEEIRQWAVSVLNGIEFDDLDNGVDDNKGYRSLMTGTEPLIKCFNSAAEESDFIVCSLKQLTADELSKSCISVRRNSDIDRYKLALTEAKIEFFQLDNSTFDDFQHQGVRLATMHRIKGLEFDYMYVAGINDGVLPLNILDSDDVTVIKAHEWHERSLLYVAISRAKRFCAATGFGKLSEFVENF